MNVRHGIEGLKQVPAGSVMSIGNFDGMHLGHARILETMKQLRDTLPGGARLAVVTFEPHPLTVLRPHLAPPRLTSPAMKQALLESSGVDELVILPPTREVLDVTAEQFWAILRDEARPSHLVEGSSFNFGKNRGGTIDKLREWSRQGGSVQLHVVDAVQVPLLDLQIVDASSTLIRWLISYGRMRDAAICFGRPYVLRGPVIRGHGRGRQIGVPTANLDCREQLIPADGVYAGRCTLDGRPYPAALSIGTLPTFGEHDRQVEAYLIGFDGDLYDKTIEVEVLDWVREQIRFEGIASLKAQIERDVRDVIQRVNLPSARPIARLSLA